MPVGNMCVCVYMGCVCMGGDCVFVGFAHFYLQSHMDPESCGSLGT